MQIEVPLTDWSLYLLHHWDLERIKDLEEEGEPYTPEREQMQKRKNSYMRTGEAVQELVAGIDVENRNWRIYPYPSQPAVWTS
jgi:hypothetical protein